MINTLKPAAEPGHKDQKGEILERISREYGKPEEKQREAVKKLGKDEFFKIMVTQIQHQDPLKPYQNEQMAAQMAQFTALEQMINVNQNLDKLTTAQTPLQQLSAANLIGKYVTSDSSRIIHTEGKYSDIAFDLPADASHVHVSIMNDHGENVREIEAENLKKGPVKLDWDGKKSNNMAAASGNYTFIINAKTENDKPVQAQTLKTEVVHGVGFEGKDTVLLTGDLRNPHKMFLKTVSKIVDPSSVAANAATPGVGGLPPGVQIGGIENPMNKENPKEETPPGNEAALIEAINSGERPVEGMEVGKTSKFSPVNVNDIRKSEQKPVMPESLSNDQIRRLMAERPDLSAANPAAEAVREGRPIPNTYQNAARQSVPSGEDGSTAGKLTE